VREAGGILTMEDLRNYKVEVKAAMAANVMGYTILGMPPPSSGSVGLSLVNNLFFSSCSCVIKGLQHPFSEDFFLQLFAKR